tara:strand:+ start:2404 stop:4245 length:1842 start_codon:yes stop_codon:yes gene_type:complete
MAKLILELGINHNGNFQNAKKLIDQSAEIGCWGIKFQYRDLKKYLLKMNKGTELGKEIIDYEIKKNFITEKQIIQLAIYGKKLGLKCGISFFSERDVNNFPKKFFDFYKVPSPVSDNYKLIKKLKNLNKKLIISFGGKNYSEIKKIIQQNNLNSKNTVIMHCISNYPVNEINSNLGFIDELKKNYKICEIGYSSHENDIFNSILCLTKNIDYIERHITLNKNSKGLDHSSSSDISELKRFQSYNLNFHKIYLNKKKFLANQGEILNKQNLGMSYYFKKNLKKGTKLKKSHVYLTYPNIGITDLNLSKYLNKEIVEDFKKNYPVTESCFEKILIKKKHLKLLNKNVFSLPIRSKDYLMINNEVQLNNYEFHMSFNDVKNFKLDDYQKKFLLNNNFTFHMPDYCDSNHILDFFSDNKIIRKKSNDLLKKTIKICNQISKINKNTIKIIVSLSKLTFSGSNQDYYKKIKKLSKNLKIKYKIEFYPQWLPVKAWYFGGTVDTKAFSDPNDLSYLKKINLNICLDTSHFILSCNYYRLDPDLYFKKYKNLFMHYHFSDAKGEDGEGIPLGKGSLTKLKLFKNIINDKKTIKVIETWQGHLNNCFNFKKDILKLNKYIK